MSSRFILLSGLLLLTAGAVLILPRLAAGQATGLTIRPVKILHTLKPGETVSGTILLNNASSEAVRVDMKIEDFVPAAGGEGIQFVGRAEGVTTVRDWISLAGEQTFIFAPGEGKNISYTITAPPDAEPGGHFGVAFFKASRLESDEGQQLKIGTQVGVLIFVTVPGDFLQQGKLLDFSGPTFVQGGPVKFKIRFENTGTVHFAPTGAVRITNLFGREVGNVPISGQVVLPTGVKEWLVEWPAAGLLLGRYQALAKVVDGEGNELTGRQLVFYAAPIRYLVGFLLAIIVAFFGLKWFRRRVRFSVSLKNE